MAPKKKIVKKIVRTVRKVPPAGSPSPSAPPSAPIVSEQHTASIPDDSPAEQHTDDVVHIPKEEAKPVENEDDAKPIEDDEAKPIETAGKKVVKKVRKVKKVIVRKVKKVKEPEAEKETDAGGGMLVTVKRNVTEPDVTVSGDGVGKGSEVVEKGVEEKREEEGKEEDGMGEMSERRRRRKTEIFIGGLDRSAGEEDVRKVFGKVGEIVEVRIMMDVKTGMNKGYAFLRYATAAQARQAVAEFNKVKVCGKLCGASAIEGNDTIFIGNIDKKWKKEDVIKLLKEIGIEKIDTVTVMPDPLISDINRGFAFLELETNRDAQLAYKKLQKKGVFGVHNNIKVAWATPLNEPDEEDMQKVKSVYAEGIPSTWSETEVREHFDKFGEIERVVLSRNIQSAKRKDFAFVNYTSREAALACIEAFSNNSSENESKVNIKVSLAKPVNKGKQFKDTSKPVVKEMPKERPGSAQTNVKASAYSSKGKTITREHDQPVKRELGNTVMERKSSTTVELLQVLREQASWKQGQMGYTGVTHTDPVADEHHYASRGEKRPYSSLGKPTLHSDSRITRARSDVYHAAPSGAPLPSFISTAPRSYFQRASTEYLAGAPYMSNSNSSFQGNRLTSYTGNRGGY